MEKRVEDIEASIKMLTSVVEQRTISLNRSKSNMEKRVEDIEASIKKLTSTVDRMVESVSGAVDKMDRRIFSMQMRLGGIEQHFLTIAKNTDKTVDRVSVWSRPDSIQPKGSLSHNPSTTISLTQQNSLSSDEIDLTLQSGRDNEETSERPKVNLLLNNSELEDPLRSIRDLESEVSLQAAYSEMLPERQIVRKDHFATTEGAVGINTPDANQLSLSEIENLYKLNKQDPTAATKKLIEGGYVQDTRNSLWKRVTKKGKQLKEKIFKKKRKTASGNQIGKHAWGDMGTSDPQVPPSPKRRRTRAREADRPPTPGIGGKQIHLKNKDQFKSQYKFNLGEIVLREWKPKSGEFGQPGWHKVKIIGRRLRTGGSPKYKVKWHGYPSWDAVPASWVVEGNLKKSV